MMRRIRMRFQSGGIWRVWASLISRILFAALSGHRECFMHLLYSGQCLTAHPHAFRILMPARRFPVQHGAPTTTIPFHRRTQCCSHVQAGRKHHIPPDQLPRLLHFLVETRIPNKPRRTHHLPARLIQPRHNSHNRPFHHVRQIRDSIERHPPRPLVHNLHEPEPRP
jgi:hypothetical protein